jgi:4,5:9,10-diseco-3-hydroxy-5,9,17-trioxoandrosta-1(10),2-diene-4-oate hydrolase
MTAPELPLPLDRFAELETGLRLHYLDVGHGPVVVWLHGSGPGASGYSNFRGNYPAFVETGFRNIVLDLPGFGRSDKPADAHYDLDFFVANLNALLKTIGVERCTLLPVVSWRPAPILVTGQFRADANTR